MEIHLISLNSESLKVVLEIHKGKIKYMANSADCEEIDLLIDQETTERGTKFKYLGQTTLLKDTTTEDMPGSEQRGAVLGKIITKKYFKIDSSPYHSKKTKQKKTSKQTTTTTTTTKNPTPQKTNKQAKNKQTSK